MKFNAKFLVLTLAVAAGAAWAAGDRTDPDAIARSEVMRSNGGAMKTLGGMASGEVAFDAAAAQAAKDALAANAAAIPEKFANQGGADPASEAKPEIWANWDDFAAKAQALADAAAALDVTSVETIGAGMGAIGGACKDCHTTYRVMN